MRTTQTTVRKMLMLLAAMVALARATHVQAAAFTASVTGDWSDTATWGGSGPPGASDTVTINPNITVTVSDARSVTSVAFSKAAGNTANKLAISGTGSLTASAAFSISTGSAGTSTIDLSGSAGSLTMSFTGTPIPTTIVLTTGSSGSTVEYSGGAQTVRATSYANLTLSGSGAKTMTGVTAIGGNLTGSGTCTASLVAATAVGGNLIISGAAFTTANTATDFSVTGTTTISSGSLILGGQSSAGTYTGDFTVNGGTFNQNDGKPNFAGNFTYSSGTVSSPGSASGRLWTFSGTGKTISGTFTIPSQVAVSGTIQNNGTLTIAAAGSGVALSGAGTWTQGANSSLTIGNGVTALSATAVTVTTLNCTANTPNTVTYALTGGGCSPKVTTYYNLTIACGANTPALTGIVVNNNYTISAGVNAVSTWPTSPIGGTLTYCEANSSTLPSTYSVGALVQTNGTLVVPSSGNLTVTGTGSGTFSRSAGTFTTTGATVTFNGAAPEIAGTVATTFVNLTLNNSTGATMTTGPTINGTLTLTAGAVSGNLTMGANSTIVRGAGTLGSAPTFTTSVNVTYNNSVTTGPEIPTATTLLKSLTINNAGGVLLTANVTAGNSSGTLTLTAGQLDLNGNTLTLATGSAIVRDTGTMSAAPTFAGTVNVTYTGSTAATTGVEMPTSASALNALAVNNTSAGGITLGANITANGACTVAASAKLNVPTTMEIKSTLVITAGGLVAVSNGGILKNSGASTITSTATTLTFASGAKFQHAVTTTTGTVPTAGWNANSTLEIMNTGAIGGTPPSGLAQNFGNVTWDNTQSSGCNLVGVNLNSIAGTFTVKNTGTFDLRLGSSQSPTETWGNLVLQGGTLTTSSSTGVPVLNVAGNVTFAGGALTIVNAAPLNVGGDWTRNTGTFTPGTGTVTFNGSGAQAITGSATSQTFNSLRVNKSANDLSIGGSITEAIVNGTLTLTSGKIVTGANKVTVASTGSISGGSGTSYVYGNLDRGLTTSSTAATFPVGDSLVYAPVSLASVVCTANGDVVVSTTPDKNATGAFGTSGINPAKYVNRDWTISAINGYAQSAGNVTFNFDAGDIQGGMSTSADIVKKYNGSIWSAPTVVGRSATSITVSGINSFSDWIIGELPVPAFSGLTASPSITYGATNVTLGGNLTAGGPVYPMNGSTVTASINGQAVNGTVTDNAGNFVINYNHASLATDSVSGSPYTITYSFAGDANVAAAANDTSTSLTVGKATPSLAVTNSPVIYNGSPQSAAVNGSAAGVVSNVKYDGSPTAPTIVGTYAVTADFTPTDAANYNSLTDAAAGSFVIQKATPTLSVVNSPVTYNGSPQSADINGSVAGSVSNVKYDGSSTAPSAPGTYAVTADFAPTDTTNYNSLSDASAGAFVINKVTTTVTVTSSANPSGFNDGVTFTATVDPAEASGDVIFKVNGAPLGTNALSLGTATNLTMTLLRGTNTVTAEYSGDSNYLVSTNELPGGQVVTNHPPVVVAFAFGALSGIPTTFKVIGGKYAPTDADADTLTVSTVENPSANGATVTTDQTNVTYTALGSFAGIDTFNYTVSDGFGGLVTSTVTVTVSSNGQGFNSLSLQALGGGDVQLTYLGIPGTNYALDRAFSLTPPVTWTPQITNPAAENGYLIFTNTPDPSTNNFWRTRYVP